MGNGISRTYPVGILKPQPKTVRFDKPEVRTYQQDRWVTRPLLNTHETARLEAKIRAMPMQPKPVLPPPPKKMNTEDKVGVAATTLITTVIATAIACGFLGPFGLLVPAGVLVTMGLVALLKPRRPAISPEKYHAAVNAVKHMDKLIRKHEQAGLKEQADIYRKTAAQIRKRYKL